MFRRRLIFSFLFGCLSLTVMEAANVSAFTGKWELDKKRTEAAGAPEDLKLEIDQKGDSVIIKSKYREPKSAIYPLLWVGIMTYELELSTDGSEKINHIGPFTHVSKTAVEGSKMTTDFTATIENGSVTGQWIRTVSPDGNEMTCEIHTKSSDGRTLNQTLFFKKK